MAEDIGLNIRNIYDRKIAALYALSLNYASLAINYFREVQSRSGFWKNQTGQARDRMFTDAFIEENTVGWFMAHGVDYGVYLELANDGRFQAIRPVIQRYAGRFYRDARRIFSDN